MTSRSSPAPVTSGPEVLAARLGDLPLERIVLGLDFDGTLAPIVVDPDKAKPDRDTLALLERLACRLLRLVLISGRDSDLLWERVPIPNTLLIGNHGLEERRDGVSRLSAQAQPYADNLLHAADALASIAAATGPGIRIEQKRASIGVHFRQSPDPQASGAQLGESLSALAGQEHLRLFRGRYVWELRPAVEVNKGTVVAGLAGSLHPAGLIYVGDDVTDADAFRAMRDLPNVRTLAVGVRSAEVPTETFDACDLVVDGVEGVKTLLADLLAVR
ncbi:MAG: trehalose-phosphatase [Candidatus Dormibacteraeota bacterium]|nr:trehalose-phosphatase [Candidatus Dormibacteraeota bacterium]